MATTQPSTAAKAKSTSATKRKPAAARRRTAKPAAARRSTGATTATRRPATRAERVQQLAERAVLIPVGAALEARDLAVTYRSRSAVEAQLTRFERRGGKARRQARSRIEREARRARREIDRQRTQVRRNLPLDVEQLSSRVENVVQSGVDLGMKLVNGAQDRLTKAA